MVATYADLEQRLGPALAANSAGSGIDHVVIILPSFSVSESILSHYGDRIPSLEHRYLNALLMGSRLETVELVFISTRRPDRVVLDYYTSLVPPDRRESVRRRVRIVEIDDGTPRSVAAKLLDRPALLAELRRWVGDRPAVIEPWNVTDPEVSLAVSLGIPINGTRPELRQLGFKSEGRRLFRAAGVAVPLGREDVRTVDDVVAAVLAIRAEHPDAPGVVIKHDDSGAGDGNVVIDLAPLATAGDPASWLRDRVAGLPDWYLADLERGGIVEERIVGFEFSSPSAQVDIRPDGQVVVLATHEQVLGGPGGQVYLGCRFPADGAYAPDLAEAAAAVGEQLAQRGALGRFSVDFVTARGEGDVPWRIYALEVNLRKGGTTHPYAALRNVAPGRYDAVTGRWLTDLDGSERHYSATDNLVDEAWRGLAPAAVIEVVADAGLQFDPVTQTGTILHMLSGLSIDGRFGVTAIAETAAAALAMQDGVVEAVDRLAS